MPSKRSSTSSSSRNRPQGNLLYDEPTGGFKKRRLARACDACRQFDVGYSSISKIDAENDYSSITVQSLVEDILSSTIPYPVPEEKDAVRRLVVNLATYARKLETRIQSLAQSLAKMNPEFPDTLTSDEPVDDGVEWLSDFLSSVSVSDTDRKGPFLGETSTLSLVKLAWNAENRYRPEDVDPCNDEGLSTHEELANMAAECLIMSRFPSGNSLEPGRQLNFPPYETILRLTDAYFAHVSVILPFLHFPSFKRRLSDSLHLRDQDFGALVLSVCACGALVNSDLQAADEIPKEEIEAWYDQFDPASMNFLRPMSLYQLQTILNSIILIPLWLPNWMILCNTIRHVQGIGIHRKQWYDQQQISPVDKELWKRAFWILVACDNQMSDYFGRTATLVPEEYDLDLPLDCDDEYWPGEHPDSGRDFQQPENKPSIIAYWIAYLELITIYRYYQRTIHAARRPQFIMGDDPNWRSKVVSQLDSAMNKWVEKMPAHLRWDPKTRNVDIALDYQASAERHRILEVQKASLYLTYYCLQIQMHFPLVAKAPGASATLTNAINGGSDSHLIVCVNAARSCVHLLDMYSEKYKVPPLMHIFIRILRLALILVFNASSRKLNGLDSNSGSAIARDCLRNDWTGHLCSWTMNPIASEIIQNLIDKCDGPKTGDECVTAGERTSTSTDLTRSPKSTSDVHVPSAVSHSLHPTINDQTTVPAMDHDLTMASNVFDGMAGLDAFPNSSSDPSSSSSLPWNFSGTAFNGDIDSIFHPMPFFSTSTQASVPAPGYAYLGHNDHDSQEGHSAPLMDQATIIGGGGGGGFLPMNWGFSGSLPHGDSLSQATAAFAESETGTGTAFSVNMNSDWIGNLFGELDDTLGSWNETAY
ncbi:hypothetical protein D9758_006711 [Tetrapyrgos nigripes]|uniref:Xylanolytic transcriptional activator regulatory domain-containing protein n=1 Tax=Tetrapyrgos nigripes TaxID=182062 RepID=A0A8H5GJP3_9AGAR|nr:hypothetical protein D9758_006711 [Tetrapyrgos nigripes]